MDGFGVNQAGQIWIEEYHHLETDWPGDHFYAEHDDQVVKIHTRAATAAAWLTAEQRAEIRSVLPEPFSSDAGHEALIAKLIERYQVAKWILFHLSQSAEGETAPWVVDRPLDAGSEIHTRTKVNIQDYRALPIEEYRAPNRAGIANALHLHSFSVDEERFAFISRGTKKSIFNDDRVSFDFIIGADGERKVMRKTLRTLDAKGNHVKRGPRCR